MTCAAMGRDIGAAVMGQTQTLRRTADGEEKDGRQARRRWRSGGGRRRRRSRGGRAQQQRREEADGGEAAVRLGAAMRHRHDRRRRRRRTSRVVQQRQQWQQRQQMRCAISAPPGGHGQDSAGHLRSSGSSGHHHISQRCPLAGAAPHNEKGSEVRGRMRGERCEMRGDTTPMDETEQPARAVRRRSSAHPRGTGSSWARAEQISTTQQARFRLFRSLLREGHQPVSRPTLRPLHTAGQGGGQWTGRRTLDRA